MSSAYQTSGFAYQGSGEFAYQEGVAAPVANNSGGWEDAKLGPRRRDPEEIRRERVRYGILPEIIEDVAARQAGDPRLDDRQRIEELAGELKLRGLEMKSAHIEALNLRREQIILGELQAIFRQQQDDRDIAVLLMLAASA